MLRYKAYKVINFHKNVHSSQVLFKVELLIANKVN